MEALQRLDVWRRSCQLSVNTYFACTRCRERSFRDQLTRSTLSVASNIAEGYERDSLKERVQFLRYAKGSCGEVWTQLWIGIRAGFLDNRKGRELAAETEEISRMLAGLIRHFTDKPGN